MESIRVAALRQMIDDHCIVRVPRGSKELPALGDQGGYYEWQFYLRRALLDPHSLMTIATDFWERNDAQFRAHEFQIAGVECAAVPMMTAIILAGADRGHKVNAFTIRKERKTFGLKNIIEGVPNSYPVLLIDDLTSPQHRALWHAVQVVSQLRLLLYGYSYVLVRKTAASAPTAIATSIGTMEIQSLFTLSDFHLSIESYVASRLRLSCSDFHANVPNP